MTKEEKQAKIISLINTFTGRTRNGTLHWTHKPEGYIAPFDTDTVEFSFQSDEDFDNVMNFVLIFINPEGVQYEIFYVINPESPGYHEFEALRTVVEQQEEERFFGICDRFMAEGG